MSKKYFSRIWVLLAVLCLIPGAVWMSHRRQEVLLERCGQNLAALYPHVNEYESKHGGQLPTKMSQLPVDFHCPVSGESYKFRSSTWKDFEMYCEGEHHLPISREPNFPRYGVQYPSGPQLSNNPMSAMNARHFEL